jgi:uncharacterized protein YoxC
MGRKNTPASLSTLAPVLDATLRQIRRRQGRRALSVALLRGFAVLGGVLFFTTLLLAFKQSWARPVGWTLALLAVAAWIVRGVQESRRLAQDDRRAARALGVVSPEDASDLLSAVELSEALKSDSPPSDALVRAHLSRMSQRAARMDARPAVGVRPAVQASGLLIIALVAHALLFAFGGPHVRDGYAFLVGRLASTAPLFAPEPIAGDVTLIYRYPAHMSRSPKTIPSSDGDISAPKGTIVSLTARADRDVVQASAVLTTPGQPPKVVPLEVKGRALSGQILIEQAGAWRFRYSKASGSTVAEGPDRPVAIEADNVPDVRLTKPAQEIEVGGQESVPLAWSVTDDYGLRNIDLVWNTGKGVPEQRRKLAEFTNAKETPRRDSSTFSWAINELGFSPGDRITFRLEAFDNDTVSGGTTGKKGVSDSRVLKIFSETEHHSEVLKQAQEQWEKLVGGLGDRLEEPSCGASGEKTKGPWAANTRSKDGMMTALALDMRSLAKKLNDDKHAPPEIGRALAHVGARLASSVEATSDARESLIHYPQAMRVNEFQAVLRSEVKEEESGVLYLEDLMDRRRLLDLAQLTRELKDGRKELADLVKQYKDAPTEENKRKILAQVQRLKERMSEIRKRMQELAREIQDEHLNAEAQALMEQGNDFMSKLDELQKDLSKGSGDEALKAVQDLEKQLDDMEKKFEDGAGETDEETKKLGQELQQLASDFMDLQGDQAQLKKETDDLRAKEKQAVEEKAKKLGQEFVDKERERIKKARAELGNVDPKVAERLSEDEALQGVQDRLNQLDRALQAKDFDEAGEQAQLALRGAEQVRQRLTAERDFMPQRRRATQDPGAVSSSADHAEKANTPIQQIADDLDKLMQSAQPNLSEGEKQKMKELGQRQASVQKRTQEMGEKLDKMGQQMPIVGPGQTQLLKDAAESMAGAKGSLGKNNPRGASSQQGDALEKMSKFAQSMRQQKGGSGGGGGMPMPFGTEGDDSGEGDQEGSGGGPRNEKVEIPTADQSHAPAEFRKDILDAMKDKSPEKYKDRVKGYYEELVK